MLVVSLVLFLFKQKKEYEMRIREGSSDVCSSDLVPRIEIEMTMIMWRKHCTCDILGENGSAHIESLCKWGPSTFRLRTRILPAGRPPEETETLECDDPTWAEEYAHFKSLCAGRTACSLDTDIWINDEIARLSEIGRANV